LRLCDLGSAFNSRWPFSRELHAEAAGPRFHGVLGARRASGCVPRSDALAGSEFRTGQSPASLQGWLALLNSPKQRSVVCVACDRRGAWRVAGLWPLCVSEPGERVSGRWISCFSVGLVSGILIPRSWRPRCPRANGLSLGEESCAS